MLRISKSTLTVINYILVLSLVLLAVIGVLYTRSPEKLIQGEWEEVGWYMERADHKNDMIPSGNYIDEQIKAEIFDHVIPFHMDVWYFEEDGRIQANQYAKRLEWYIKGRGHILELRKDGKTIESFQIHNLTKDQMELHFNLDLQIRGVVKIVLKRKSLENNYAKKI